jgi:hypothetical protein
MKAAVLAAFFQMNGVVARPSPAQLPPAKTTFSVTAFYRLIPLCGSIVTPGLVVEERDTFFM